LNGGGSRGAATLCGNFYSLTSVAVTRFLALLATAALATTTAAWAAPAGGDNKAFFEKAKKDLPGSYYFLYRIVDRVARANGLDETPWRVRINPRYDINAFASETNLLSIYGGLLDQLAGDNAAIACVVGHEMAHHVHRHIAVGQKQEAQAKAAVESQQRQIIEQQEERNRSAARWGAVGSLLGLPLPIRGGDSEDVVKKKLSSVGEGAKEELLALSRSREMESDRSGYQYMARAGFDPQGCLRVLEVLGRGEGAEFDTTHPAIPRRVEQMKQLMTDQPAARLAEEGKARLQSRRPLTYEVSADRQSLRINSRHAGAPAAFPNDL
jgi:predicted Zn-dependent protease